MAAVDETDLSSKRPRRSCVQKEVDQDENSGNSDSESSIETPDNSNDEDFSLTAKPKKRTKKKKQKLVRERERKTDKIVIPSYLSVMKAHGELEQRLAEKSYVDSYSDCSSEQESECNIEEAPIEPQLAKKKKIVIRPWNPGWYQINHQK